MAGNIPPASMAGLSDYILDSKLDILDTSLSGKSIVHCYRDPDYDLYTKGLSRQEYWKEERFLGHGGCGSVYLQRCFQGKRELEFRALKTIHVPNDWPTRPQYTRELETIAKLSQKKFECWFVKSFGWYEKPGSLCIAMEYLELGDLDAHIRNTALREDESKVIASQILEGVEWMHNKSIAHRDLKPGNILVKSRPPDNWWVKISDFGLSKQIVEQQENHSSVRGTHGYMAPELYVFGLDVSSVNWFAADMWSIGAMLFFSLTRQAASQNHSELGAYASALGKGFISSLMSAAPNERPTVSKARQHSWIEGYTPSMLTIPTLTLQSDNEQSRHPQLWTRPAPEEPAPEEYATWSSQQQPQQPVTSPPTGVPESSTSSKTELSERFISQEIARMSESTITLLDMVLGSRSKLRQPKQCFQAKLGRNSKLRSTSTLFSPRKSYRYKILRLVFSPSGGVLAVGGLMNESTSFAASVPRTTKTVELWDGKSGDVLHDLPGLNSLGSLAEVFSPGGSLMATFKGGIIRLWDVSTGVQLREVEGSIEAITNLAFSPDGSEMASAVSDGIRIWSTDSGRLLKTVSYKDQGRWRTIAFSSDGSKLFISRESPALEIWDRGTGTKLKHWVPSDDNIRTFCHSADGKKVAFPWQEGNPEPPSTSKLAKFMNKKFKEERPQPWGVKLRDLNSDKELCIDDSIVDSSHNTQREDNQQRLKPSFNAFSPDGTLVSVDYLGHVFIIDSNTGTQLSRHKMPDGGASPIVLSKDGATIARTRHAGIMLLDTKTGAISHVNTHRPYNGYTYSDDYFDVTSVTFSPDGNTLAVGCSDGTTSLWTIRGFNNDNDTATRIYPPTGTIGTEGAIATVGVRS